jgi:hypothetical protein
MIKKHFSYLIILGILTSCSVSLKTTKPDLPATSQDIPATDSYFNIPVQLNLNEISKTISDQMPAELYNQKGMDVGYGVKVDVTVTRRGNFTFTTTDGNLNMSVPLYISGKASLSAQVCAICPKIEKTQPFSLNITVNTTSQIAVSPNWELKTKTNSNIHLDNPMVVNILGFNISLESYINNIIKAQLPKLDAIINDKVNNSYNVKEYAENLWKQLSQPYMVLDKPLNIWLSIMPFEFDAAPPVSANSTTLLLNFGVKTKIKTNIGDKPVVTIASKLPQLKNYSLKSRSFVTDIPVCIQLSQIIEASKKELVGKTFPIPDMKKVVVINDLDIFGSGNELVIRVNVTSGKIKGNLYILAEPEYDKVSKMFKVRNLKFDSQTNSIVTNKAAWLANKLFISKIEKNITYSIAGQLSDAQKSIDENLNKLSFNGSLLLNAKITEFDVQNIFFDASYAYMNLKINGNMDVQVK